MLLTDGGQVGSQVGSPISGLIGSLISSQIENFYPRLIHKGNTYPCFTF